MFPVLSGLTPVSYTHLDVYKRQALGYDPTGKRDVVRPRRRETGSGTGLRPSPWSGDDDDYSVNRSMP